MGDRELVPGDDIGHGVIAVDRDPTDCRRECEVDRLPRCQPVFGPVYRDDGRAACGREGAVKDRLRVLGRDVNDLPTGIGIEVVRRAECHLLVPEKGRPGVATARNAGEGDGHRHFPPPDGFRLALTETDLIRVHPTTFSR